MTLARGREQGPFDRAIDVQVSRLRNDSGPAQPLFIKQFGALRRFYP